MSLGFKFQGTVEDFTDSSLWGHHIMVPHDISTALKKDYGTRIIAHLNDVLSIHCALLSDGKGQYYFMLNKEVRKKLHLTVGKSLNVLLEPDQSKYGMPMPEELGELLALDEDGSKYFHKLTPGKQRNLIHMVGKHKTEDTRIRKALVIVNYLKNAHGNLNFQELNQAFKESNKRF